MKPHLLPAGLIDHNYEFFVSGELHAYCLTHGKVYSFNEFSDDILASIESQIPTQKLIAIYAMGVTDRKGVIEQFISCNYGGFDHRPDMVDGVLQQTEFWACPKRGQCAQEGVLCDQLQTPTGKNLSPREVEVIKHIATGKLDKEIAGELNISIGTVTTHTRNIRVKTGLPRKTDITRFAHDKNLI